MHYIVLPVLSMAAGFEDNPLQLTLSKLSLKINIPDSPCLGYLEV